MSIRKKKLEALKEKANKKWLGYNYIFFIYESFFFLYYF